MQTWLTVFDCFSSKIAVVMFSVSTIWPFYWNSFFFLLHLSTYVKTCSILNDDCSCINVELLYALSFHPVEIIFSLCVCRLIWKFSTHYHPSFRRAMYCFIALVLGHKNAGSKRRQEIAHCHFTRDFTKNSSWFQFA